MIEWLSRIALHEPLWLWLLPLPWLALRGRRRAGGGRLARFADPHLLEWLTVRPDRGPGRRAVRSAWLLIIVALSGPHLDSAAGSRTPPGLDLAVVMDISPSMLAADLDPDRLQHARLELRDFVSRLGNDRTALVAYSAYAYDLLPLTHDHNLLQHYVDHLTPTLTRRRGSNLVQALELAARTLEAAGRRGRAIVLLSDGEAHDREAVLAAADRLGARAIPVYALGVGTATGAPVPAAAGGYLRRDGAPVTSRSDRELLGALAARTGGVYSDSRADDNDWQRIFDGLAGLTPNTQASHRGRQTVALYPWLFAAGLALLLWNAAGRRTLPVWPLAGLAAAATLFPGEAAATPWREQAAREALTDGRHHEALRLYRGLESFAGRLGLGAAAYRLGDWSAALEAFIEAERRAANAAQRADAIYNQGNTLVRLGRLDAAARAFERALDLRPGHKAAALNLRLVTRARSPGPDTDDAGPPRPGTGDADAPHGAAGDRPRGEDGSERNAALQRAIRRWRRGDVTGDLAAAGALRDRSGEVLRQRFMVQDVEHPLPSGESRPW